MLPLPPLDADPLSRTVWGATRLEALREIAEPTLDEAQGSPSLAEALRQRQPSFEAVAAVPLRSAERLLGLALLYFGPHAPLPASEALVHLGFLARVLTGSLEASAAREANSTADRLRVLSRPSAAAVASLLARLPPESARRQRLALSEVIAPLEAPGVSLVAESGASVFGDAPLLRFALATLVRQCEAAALEHGRIPEVTVRVEEAPNRVQIQVTGGGRASVMAVPEAGPDLADAELSVVHAIVAMHGGVLVAGHAAVRRRTSPCGSSRLTERLLDPARAHEAEDRHEHHAEDEDAVGDPEHLRQRLRAEVARGVEALHEGEGEGEGERPRREAEHEDEAVDPAGGGRDDRRAGTVAADHEADAEQQPADDLRDPVRRDEVDEPEVEEARPTTGR